MSYLIAVATSNAKDVDLGFGAAKGFYIYEVDGTGYKEKEYREFTEEPGSAAVGACGSGGGCGAAAGCGSALSGGEADTGAGAGKQPAGCGGPANGCGGSDGAQRKVELIADCRSLVCKKIGFQAQKQLEKRAIAGFDVDCTIDEAITKIAVYFNKIDNHISLRR
ncbi:MAG: hypothetical protein IKZ97_01405 [Butyrivibrio sp.]|nr:hypothetical protein [Butyrivibrio sp.]